MLPEVVWAMPPCGTFNLHASLLPNYRGAAPINWAVINGEKYTGATTFLLDKEIDTGNLLFQYTCELPPHWTAGDLHDHLMVAGASLVLQTANALEDGIVQPKPQNIALALHHAPKLHRETGQLDWHQPTETLRNRVRGLAPFPGAWTIFQGKLLKVYEIAASDLNVPLAVPGTWYYTPHKLLCATADGWAELLQIQPDGKRRMAAADFVRGLR
jgi:methionyl-tRNA formyltransferase